MKKYMYIGCMFTLLCGCANVDNTTKDSESPGTKVINECWAQKSDHVNAVNCESEKLAPIKAKMDTLYNKEIIDARKFDTNMRAAGSLAFIDSEDAVRKSQQDFERYIDSECERRVAYVMGGTFGADTEIACRINLMLKRIEELSQYQISCCE